MAGGALAAAVGMAASEAERAGASADHRATTRSDTVTYRSRPDLQPPRIEVTRPSGDPAPGLICVTPGGPMLVDDAGEPVWIHPVPHAATNLRVQQFQERPVLTWWQGRIAPYGVGVAGSYIVLDGSYRRVMTVGGRHDVPADLHEFLIDGRGVAYFTGYRQVERDLRAAGGPKRGTMLDAVVQGVELASGKLVFDWRSSDHIALDESHSRYKTSAKNHFPFDPVHVNSIDTTADGNLLISARNTWALYKVDPTTGAIVWRLGGRRSDFALGPGVRFAWQHDAKSHPGNIVTVFDDEGDPPEAAQSRGLVLSVDEGAMRVTLTHAYLHPGKGLLAGSQGSMQLLPNGDVFVGWGAEPYYTEYRADGTAVLDAKFAKGQSYRAFRFPWTGMPDEQPAVAAERRPGRTTVYASWNGSTETARWEALGGSRPGVLVPMGSARRSGFETSITFQGQPGLVAARALDSRGAVLATSEAISV